MRYIIFLVISFFTLNAGAQAGTAGLNLQQGSIYRITQKLQQNTESSQGSIGSASLDILMSLDLKVISSVEDRHYEVTLSYSELSLSMFAPSLNVALNSEGPSGKQVRFYLDKLMEKSFSAELSVNGEIRGFRQLNDAFGELTDTTLETDEEERIILKTLKEAFGEEAITSMFNISMNIHGPAIDRKVDRRVIYYFNQRALEIQNSFYFQPPKENSIRVQGLGIIPQQQLALEVKKGDATSIYEGNLTYDLLFDSESHWIREGISKQRISIITEFHNNDQYPEGLRLPSRTDSEIVFSGKIIPMDN